MKTTIEVFNEYNDALVAGDFAKVFDTMADDIIWHQPGNSSVSGTIIGKEKLGAHLATFGEKSNGTFRVIANWASTNSNLVAANVTFKAEKPNGDILDMNGVDLFRIEDEKIREVWLFSSDQKEEDNFWA